MEMPTPNPAILAKKDRIVAQFVNQHLKLTLFLHLKLTPLWRRKARRARCLHIASLVVGLFGDLGTAQAVSGRRLARLFDCAKRYELLPVSMIVQ